MQPPPPAAVVLGTVSAVLRSALMIVTTALVAVYYVRHPPAGVDDEARPPTYGLIPCWTLTPVPCALSDAAGMRCAVARGDEAAALVEARRGWRHWWNCSTAQACGLTGKPLEYERIAMVGTGLFAAVGPPVLCLASVVTGAVFSFGYVYPERPDAEHLLQKSMKRLGLLLTAVYAVFFLCVRGAWHLPTDNLGSVEAAFLAAALYVSFNPSPAYAAGLDKGRAPARLVEAALSAPPLVAAALAAAGVDVAAELAQAFACVTFACLFLAAADLERAGRAGAPPAAAAWVLSGSAWLCALPFFCLCGQALDGGVAPLARSAWAVAALALALAMVVALLGTVTAASAWLRPPLFARYVAALDAQMLVGQAVVALTLVVGGL